MILERFQSEQSWQFDCPLVLAPMAGVTDQPFRQLCLRYGASFVVTEMVSSNPSLRDNERSKKILALNALDDNKSEKKNSNINISNNNSRSQDSTNNIQKALNSVQIAGSDPSEMADVAQYCVMQGAEVIDINMGCPAKKINKKMAGAALLQDPRKVESILKSVVASVSVPVTLKIRTGWDKDSNNALLIGQIAQESGLSALTIHGRSRACLFKGEAEYDTIRQVKKAIAIPVIANGDIDTPEKAQQVLEQTGADGLMIGRGALGRPWLFEQIRSYLSCGQYQPPTFELWQETVIEHVKRLHQFYGPYLGLRIARKHVRWYLSDKEKYGDFLCLFNGIEDALEQLDILHRYFQMLKEI